MYRMASSASLGRFAASAATSGIAALVLATAAGPAGAATTVGSVGAPSNCGSGFMEAQFNVAGPPTYFFPTGGGVVTSWSAAFTAAGQGTKLLILERVTFGPPPVYRVVAKSDVGIAPGAGTQTFQTQIPVRSGQEIGVYGFACASASIPGDIAAASSSVIAEPAIGQEQALASLGSGFRASVSAELEPDCDSDGNGDETQDTSLIGGTCPRRSLSLNTNKRNVKKGKKVTLSGEVAPLGRQGAECFANQPVELLRKKPSAGDFKAFATVQTDAQGQFSLKQKLKKTTEFSARLQQTASCVAADSETEKVKVKKKK
jgi:hypothetical protein